MKKIASIAKSVARQMDLGIGGASLTEVGSKCAAFPGDGIEQNKHGAKERTRQLSKGCR
jgi:hypothetical protein